MNYQMGMKLALAHKELYAQKPSSSLISLANKCLAYTRSPIRAFSRAILISAEISIAISFCVADQHCSQALPNVC